MEKELQILFIEDDCAEAVRLLRELKRQGVLCRSERVETREDFLRSLDHGAPDLILADQGRPSFTSFEALELAQEKCPRTPFVFVTGQYDQGLVVEMFDGGAAGYVCKNDLAELGVVIRQALNEASQRDRSRVQEAPGDSSAQEPGSLRQMKPEDNNRLICSRCKRICDEHGTWEDLATHLQKHGSATVTLSICPACAPGNFWRGLPERRSNAL